MPVGEIRQRPPAYSAVKVGGERLHRRARRGEPIEGEERTVVVHSFDLLRRDGDRAEVEVRCSAGTYVRQLVAAFDDAYCEELERTRVGPFRLEDADPERPVPLADALSFLPERPLDEDEARSVSHGSDLAAADPAPEAGGPLRLTHAGELLAVYEPRDGRLRPLVVFAS